MFMRFRRDAAMSAPMVGGTSKKMVRAAQASSVLVSVSALSASVVAVSPPSVTCCSFSSRTLSYNETSPWSAPWKMLHIKVAHSSPWSAPWKMLHIKVVHSSPWSAPWKMLHIKVAHSSPWSAPWKMLHIKVAHSSPWSAPWKMLHIKVAHSTAKSKDRHRVTLCNWLSGCLQRLILLYHSLC